MLFLNSSFLLELDALNKAYVPLASLIVVLEGTMGPVDLNKVCLIAPCSVFSVGGTRSSVV